MLELVTFGNGRTHTHIYMMQFYSVTILKRIHGKSHEKNAWMNGQGVIWYLPLELGEWIFKGTGLVASKVAPQVEGEIGNVNCGVRSAEAEVVFILPIKVSKIGQIEATS